ncbi:MAG: ornithine racemase Orr [Romboutsia sp.]|uniref:ornithine racemase Orr n=1 Tax=Romboutsia sp. TaxID=1965302 RepID=UPI003F3DD248
MYPRLEINISKLKHNIATLSDICKTHNLDMAMVTKVYCAIPEVVKEVSCKNVDYLADSRVENLKKLQDINIHKILLRIPMISEIKDVINYVDISFNSELKTIYKLNEEAKNQAKTHKIVLMFDLGDLREGYFNEDEFFSVVEEVLKLENLKLFGIATNLTCYGAIMPSSENLGRLSKLAQIIEEKYNAPLEFVSGGNSSSIDLLQKWNMPDKITNLRLGEAIALGRETAYGKVIENTYQDVFKLVCEIVELKDKPSMPIGEIGMDAFGNVPYYEDRGILKRAIVAIGKQDINIEGIMPIDKNIEILGASSDHMILSVGNCESNFEVGDKVEFLVEYGGLLTACTSKYVHKELIYNECNERELAY